MDLHLTPPQQPKADLVLGDPSQPLNQYELLGETGIFTLTGGAATLRHLIPVPFPEEAGGYVSRSRKKKERPRSALVQMPGALVRVFAGILTIVAGANVTLKGAAVRVFAGVMRAFGSAQTAIQTVISARTKAGSVSITASASVQLPSATIKCGAGRLTATGQHRAYTVEEMNELIILLDEAA